MNCSTESERKMHFYNYMKKIGIRKKTCKDIKK